MGKQRKAELAEARGDVLGLRDQLDDLTQGFEFWRDQKVASLEWTTLDEMFARWFERGQR